MYVRCGFALHLLRYLAYAGCCVTVEFFIIVLTLHSLLLRIGIAFLQRQHRSALYRLLDSGRSRCGFVVLAVSDINTPASELQITDGWYAVTASVDAHLLAKVTKGDVYVGMKLAVCSAEVTGVEPGHAVDPLDLPCNRGFEDYVWAPLVGRSPHQRGATPCDGKAQPRLTLHFNATRPAK